MAVGFRSSSIRGVSDQFTTSCAVPVPSGAADRDIVVCFIGRWLGDGVGGAITPPAEHTLIGTIRMGDTEVFGYWKRLSGSDTGNYTFTWTGSEWNNGNAVCLTGGLASGNPIEAFDTGSVNGTTYPSLSITTATEPFLAWGSYNASGDGTNDVPDNYTAIAAQDYGMTAWRIPATTGSHTAPGATANASMDLAAIIVAIKPEVAVAAGFTRRRPGPNFRR